MHSMMEIEDLLDSCRPFNQSCGYEFVGKMLRELIPNAETFRQINTVLEHEFSEEILD